MTARLRNLGCCAAAALGLLSAPARAQTAAPESGATTADFAWLAGTWEAHPAGGTATIEVAYLPPSAGCMTGVMRLVDRDKVLVVELISLVEGPGGLELRFRHFSPALEAYETVFRQVMRLTAHGPDRAVFENQVPYDSSLMSTQPRTTTLVRHGADEFIARSDIIGAGGRPAVIEATYRRRRSS